MENKSERTSGVSDITDYDLTDDEEDEKLQSEFYDREGIFEPDTPSVARHVGRLSISLRRAGSLLDVIDDEKHLEPDQSTDGLCESEKMSSRYRDPVSPEEAARLVPPGEGGIIWHAQMVQDDWKHKKHTTQEGLIKPRRPIPHVRASDFFPSLTKTADNRYIFSGVLNGWPGLRAFELLSVTCLTRNLIGAKSIKRIWAAGDKAKDPAEVFRKTKKSVRLTLRAPAWSDYGYSADSPGHVWWAFSQRSEGLLVEHGTNMIERTKTEFKEGKIPQATKIHLFAHRYSRGKDKPETTKQKLTYHSATLVEWDHGQYATIIELATLNGVGGRYGKSNWFDDKLSERPILYRRMPKEMIVPWQGMYAEIRCVDVPYATLEDFKPYLEKYTGPEHRFLDVTYQYSHAVRLSMRSQTDIQQYLINYIRRDRRYSEEFRHCQAFAADFYGFMAGKVGIEPFHAVGRVNFVPRPYAFLYDPTMYAPAEYNKSKR